MIGTDYRNEPACYTTSFQLSLTPHRRNTNLWLYLIFNADSTPKNTAASYVWDKCRSRMPYDKPTLPFNYGYCLKKTNGMSREC